MRKEELIQKIIEEQSQIIGSNLAKSRAVATGAITYTEKNEINITQEPTIALDKLMNAYREIFGQASVDVCMDVIRRLPYDQVSPYLSDSVVKALRKANSPAAFLQRKS